jgi:hypothetical protein
MQAAAPVPVAPVTTPTPTAAFTSPMAVYALGTTLDEGVSRVSSSGADDNSLLRSGRGGSNPAVLNEDVIRTIPDVVDFAPAIYAADAVHPPSECWCFTFLDSGASENCIVNVGRFITYQEVIMDSSTAVKGGGFKVAGKGIAELTVRVGDGSVHKIRFEARCAESTSINLKTQAVVVSLQTDLLFGHTR